MGSMLSSIDNLLALILPVVPIFTWLVRTLRQPVLRLSARRAGRVFRFGVHHLEDAALNESVEVEVTFDQADAQFVQAPVLLCGPKTDDLVEEWDPRQPRVFRVKANRMRPVTTWTIVGEGNSSSAIARITLIKPARQTLYATESPPPPPWWSKSRARRFARASFKGMFWTFASVGGYLLLVTRSSKWLKEHGLDWIDASSRWHFDWWMVLAMMFVIAVSYQLCMRRRRPAPLMQGYFGVDVAVPSDSGDASP